MNLKNDMTPVYSRPIIVQELYDITLAINSRQEAFIEDNGYSSPRLQGLSNAVLNFLGIFGLLRQPLKSLSEPSMVHSNKTLEYTLNQMFKELQIWCDGLPKVIKMTRANYELEFEGLIALLILRLLEQRKTLKDINDLECTNTTLLSLHIRRTDSDFDFLRKLILEAIKVDESEIATV